MSNERDIKKETLDPSTAAKDGRRKIRAYINEYRMFLKIVQENDATTSVVAVDNKTNMTYFYINKTRNGTASAAAPVWVVFLSPQPKGAM